MSISILIFNDTMAWWEVSTGNSWHLWKWELLLKFVWTYTQTYAILGLSRMYRVLLGDSRYENSWLRGCSTVFINDVIIFGGYPDPPPTPLPLLIMSSFGYPHHLYAQMVRRKDPLQNCVHRVAVDHFQFRCSFYVQVWYGPWNLFQNLGRLVLGDFNCGASSQADFILNHFL